MNHKLEKETWSMIKYDQVSILLMKSKGFRILWDEKEERFVWARRCIQSTANYSDVVTSTPRGSLVGRESSQKAFCSGNSRLVKYYKSPTSNAGELVRVFLEHPNDFPTQINHFHEFGSPTTCWIAGCSRRRKRCSATWQGFFGGRNQRNFMATNVYAIFLFAPQVV